MTEVERGGLFRSDWLRALFVHFEIDPARLAAVVPYELDLHRGRAYVSTVAFLMRGFRPRGSGPLGKVAFAAVARHGLLNLRTYVRHRGETGICFITEWIPNRLSVAIGPPLFGLPYRLGGLRYNHAHETGKLNGEATSPGQRLGFTYQAPLQLDADFQPAAPGTLDEFLLERYTAFTFRRGRLGLFRIWHEPWRQQAVNVAIADDSLFHSVGEWFGGARLIGGHYSPGVHDVWIGRPRNLERAADACLTDRHVER